MGPDITGFAQVATIIVAMVGSLSFISVLTFFLVRRISRQPPRPQVDDHRLEQLQQSVDAIAIEVERIAEAQRFSAKLLAEGAHGGSDSAIGARLGEPQQSVKR
jgi:hypothetical protein